MTTDDLDAIRARLERTGYSPWKDDTFALLDEVEWLRGERDLLRKRLHHAYLNAEQRREEYYKALAERDRAEAALARVREVVEATEAPPSWYVLKHAIRIALTEETK